MGSIKFGNVALLFVLALIWGSSFLLMKKGLLLYSPLEIAALRISISGLVLLPFLLKRKGSWFYENIWLLLAVGIVGNGIPAWLFTTAETKINSATVGSLNSLTPCFALLTGVLFFGVNWKKKQLLGLFLGLIGAGLIVFDFSNFKSDHIPYAGLVVIGTICYGLNTNILKSKLSHLGALEIVSASLILAAVPYTASLFFTDVFTKTVDPFNSVLLPLGSIVILAVLGTSFALYLFNILIFRTSPVFATSVTYLIPIVALALGWLDGEELVLRHLFGLIAVLIGVYLIKKAS